MSEGRASHARPSQWEARTPRERRMSRLSDKEERSAKTATETPPRRGVFFPAYRDPPPITAGHHETRNAPSNPEASLQRADSPLPTPRGGGEKRIEWGARKRLLVGHPPVFWPAGRSLSWSSVFVPGLLLGAWCEADRAGSSPTVVVCVGACGLVVGASDFPAKNPSLHRGRLASRTTRPGTPRNSVPPAELSSSAGGPNKDPVGSISFWMCVCVCGPSL